jgi:retron-type reverse transcriptase
MRRMSAVIDVDLSRYLDTIRRSVRLEKIAKRIQDPQVMGLVKQIIKAFGAREKCPCTLEPSSSMR